MADTSRNNFLAGLFKYCEGSLELRALPGKKRRFCELADTATVGAFCKSSAKQNVYFAVATRDGGGTKAHIKDIPAAWCDLDFKDVPEKEATKRLKAFAYPPTFIVRSGGGFQAYWQFKEAYHKEDIESVEELNRRIASALGGDQNACDASRTLRVPETLNHKYSPPRMARCTLYKPEREYDVSDFDDLPDAKAHPSAHINCISKSFIEGITSGRKVQRVTSVTKHNIRNIGFAKGQRTVTLFSLAYHLLKAGVEPANVDKYVLFVASHCDPPKSERVAKEQIKGAKKFLKRKDFNMTQAVRQFIGITSRNISITNVVQGVTNITWNDVPKLRVILHRLVKEGLLARHPTTDGIFRRVESECEDIDFMSASPDVLDIRWPFMVEQYVEIMPGNLCVLAGTIESGKTAYLLNLAKLNLDRQEVIYFSSEMGGKELKKRLLKFEDMQIEDWKPLKVKNRSADFHDVVRPDALNIIDYIELHDEFYKVGGLLKKIQEKLRGGVAVVGLQKPEGRDTGLGGDRSMEVARLYLALTRGSPNEIKIVKGKNWATDKNPNGLICRYKIVGGINLKGDDYWTR
jgi:hypothetical protein